MTTPQGIHLSIQRVETDSVTIFRLNSTSDDHGEYTTLSPVLSKFAVYRASPDSQFRPYAENVTECVLSAAAYNYSGARSNGSVFEFDRVTSIDLPMGVLNSPDAKDYDDFPRRKYYFRKEDLPQLELGWLDVLTLQKYFMSGTISSEWVVGNYDNTNPGISAALVGDVDLPARFDKMAARMTDYIRSRPGSMLANGGRVESVIFVSIRWPWLIGPAAIQLASLLFTVLTIVRSRASCEAPLWKSSALAVLSCVHDKESELIQSTAKDIKEIQETAMKSVVRLD
ncbi:hypothetical protein CDD82_5485 [Ophiocordyceps australis]|uniref:Uncharacterized protein n=1 Tax=Ophiocordyceps australis TaxID=1399860 RepID=A0A2C5Z2K6_9HYPO|nr:hypothetical protein CDD82_5485 [Ophiocordyceps australis]